MTLAAIHTFWWAPHDWLETGNASAGAATCRQAPMQGWDQILAVEDWGSDGTFVEERTGDGLEPGSFHISCPWMLRRPNGGLFPSIVVPTSPPGTCWDCCIARFPSLLFLSPLATLRSLPSESVLGRAPSLSTGHSTPVHARHDPSLPSSIDRACHPPTHADRKISSSPVPLLAALCITSGVLSQAAAETQTNVLCLPECINCSPSLGRILVLKETPDSNGWWPTEADSKRVFWAICDVVSSFLFGLAFFFGLPVLSPLSASDWSSWSTTNHTLGLVNHPKLDTHILYAPFHPSPPPVGTRC